MPVKATSPVNQLIGKKLSTLLSLARTLANMGHDMSDLSLEQFVMDCNTCTCYSPRRPLPAATRKGAVLRGPPT